MNRLTTAIQIVRYEWLVPTKKKYSSKVCFKKLKQQFPAENPHEIVRLVREAEDAVISLCE